ncbi:Transcriptional regulator acrR protein [Bibersteinia trehalosi USDA-ARS-USMARC-188]|uniref:Transcriptional regulator acrR protein n=1 Tax=Bibersteinia trehalosi USDA-ARS-USMARC-188 TaxID=1263829 RepID=A0A4V7I9S8_BIBTR|nr:TetR/AcrR family transcriptional regulator [Bibersteinia trehalosi]AHG81766.1 Transcriptional regulator acrR protein [Bibersteinia trehalosi USDA-ARS-USMARC-188]TCT18634.1 TetR family transcriptional regulator [Bibersteinia trehalosi]
MFDDVLPHNDVAIRILRAADSLMARKGIQYLSTHKIAKEAGVSVGTIYLYFKDKEELLNQLVRHLFNEFHHFVKTHYDPTLAFFEQYRQLWLATWEFMQSNPNVVANMHQYESLPTFQTMILSCIDNQELAWCQFIENGKREGVIAPLPSYVLMAMSMKVTWELMYMQLLRKETLSDAVIEEVIVRTWKTIMV